MIEARCSCGWTKGLVFKENVILMSKMVKYLNLAHMKTSKEACQVDKNL